MGSDQKRTYARADSVVFLKTDAPFGGLSNMARGFPLRVNGIRILTSEALYQACRFPHRPEVQRLIIEQTSPMTAKMKSKPHRPESRPDWDQVRVRIMRWCLRVKLAQNWRKFSQLLLETGTRAIVEESRKDDFWGAKPTNDDALAGMNVLGRLLMELREAVKTESGDSLMRVQPIAIPQFLLNGRSIGIVANEDTDMLVAPAQSYGKPARKEVTEREAMQPSLFKRSAMKEASAPAPFAINTAGIRIADLTPYAEYKESGLPWLGKVPAHWEMRPAFGAYVPNHQRNRGMKETTVLSLSYGRIVIKPADKLHGLVPESFETYQVVNPGDVVLRTTDLQNDHVSLRVGIVRDRGIITSAYLALRGSVGVSPEFGFQFLSVWDASKAIYGYGSGLRQSLDFSHFKRMPVAVPPGDEQAAIVKFLGWANGRLERAIRAKRRVIALLNEQKQLIIHRAVTRGLDPSVPLKSSGIPWLGDIPGHWQVRRMSSVARFASGKAHEQFFDPMGVHVCVTARFVSTGGASRKFSSRNLCPAVRDDVLMVMSDLPNGRALARAYLVRDDKSYAVNQRVCRLTPHSIEPRFLAYSANRSPHFLRQNDGMNQTHLSNYDFKTLPLALPPLAEQISIADHIERDATRIEKSIARLQREIDLLREYGTRLVADVVTGKLDVRVTAARLPDEASLHTVADHTDLGDENGAADEAGT